MANCRKLRENRCAVGARTEPRQFSELWLYGVTYNLYRSVARNLFVFAI